MDTILDIVKFGIIFGVLATTARDLARGLLAPHRPSADVDTLWAELIGSTGSPTRTRPVVTARAYIPNGRPPFGPIRGR